MNVDRMTADDELNQTDPTTLNRPSPLRAAFWLFGVLALMLAFIIVFVVVKRRNSSPPDGIAHPGVERLLPQLELRPLGGEGLVTIEAVRGQVVLINYWGTWCAPCRDELPYMLEIQREFGDRDDFRLFAVSCEEGLDRPELERKTAEFLRKNGWEDLPTYTDPTANSRSLLALAAGLDRTAFIYPTTVVLDRQNNIAGLWTQYRSSRAAEIYQEQRRLVAQLLALEPGGQTAEGE